MSLHEIVGRMWARGWAGELWGVQKGVRTLHNPDDRDKRDKRNGAGQSICGAANGRYVLRFQA